MDEEEFAKLISSLASFPKEVEWVEFKVNKAIPEETGEYISALANSAALASQSHAHIVWGVEDETHRLVGTKFKPREEKKGNEELENWLLHNLDPRIDFQILEGQIEGNRFVVFRIQPARDRPVRFKGEAFIRIGSYKKKLRDFPEKERALWLHLSKEDFEGCVAEGSLAGGKVLELLDYPTYFKLTKQPLPDSRRTILDRLKAEKIIHERQPDSFDISNLGALLLAYDLQDFGTLWRKAPRVTIYEGDSRLWTKREITGRRGYAVGFQGMVRFVVDQTPHSESIEESVRTERSMFPDIAIRELLANALVHQDFGSSGTRPRCEVFSDRIEISNPGLPLIDTLRFIDSPPVSRNEGLASLMRRMNICEERGSGIDKVIWAVENHRLPPPDFRTSENHTVALLIGPRRLGEIDKSERIRACYQHACLLHVSGKPMTNSTLRGRLSIDQRNSALASRVIKDTLEAGLIKPRDTASASKKHAKYVPFWT